MKQVNGSKDYQDIACLVAETDTLALKNEKLERELEGALIAETRNLNAIQKVKNENTAIKNACIQKESELKAAQTKESQAQSQLQKAEKEVAALKQQLETNVSKIDETLKSKLETDAQIRTITDTMQKMKETARQAEVDLRTHQTNMGQLKKVLAATTDELASLKALAMPLVVQADKRIPSVCPFGFLKHDLSHNRVDHANPARSNWARSLMTRTSWRFTFSANWSSRTKSSQPCRGTG